jgi:hypothetical protein
VLDFIEVVKKVEKKPKKGPRSGPDLTRKYGCSL